MKKHDNNLSHENHKFAFISRHKPTKEQIDLATAQGIELISIGDLDAFKITPAMIYEEEPYEGVIVVHPAAALRLCSDFIIGIYENGNRPGPDGKPTFFAKDLHIFDLRTDKG